MKIGTLRHSRFAARMGIKLSLPLSHMWHPEILVQRGFQGMFRPCIQEGSSQSGNSMTKAVL